MSDTGPPPRELVEFVHLFNRERFYDAHEVLEDLWVVEVPPLKDFYKGMIMAAVALCHWQRGNTAAARRMIDLAMPRLGALPRSHTGVDVHGLKATLVALRGLMDRAPAIGWEAARNSAFQPVRLDPGGD